MATGKAGIAIGVVGAGVILGLLTHGGSAHAAEAEPKEKPKSKKPTSSRAALIAKYAALFKVPASLVLATLATGYKMSLPTAHDISKKTNKKYWPSWDGTKEGILVPAVNIAMIAYYLGLWWARYKQHRLGWLLAAYAYALGPGRVKSVLPDAKKGKLPTPLPKDFSTVKGRYANVLKTNVEVLKALKQEKLKPALAGEDAPLYGKALSKKVLSTTTGYQARKMFGKMATAVNNAYATLNSYDPSGLAQATKIDAGSVKAGRQYLDDTNTMLKKYYAQMPESNDVLTSDQLTKLKAAVSTSSVAVKTIDDLFGTSFWKELGTEIVKASAAIVKGAAAAVGFDKTTAILAIGGVVAAALLIGSIKH